MIARGRVQNGVVVLDDGLHLPEGHEVTVLAPGMASDFGWVPSELAQRSDAHEIGAGEALPNTSAPSQSILDIIPVSLGPPQRMVVPDDDLLGEMLEDRS